MIRPRILIVDDDDVVRDLIGALLGPHYDISTCATAAATIEALASAAKNRTLPDLIMLDVGLPDSDGFSLCRQIKSQPGLVNIPVLFVTSRTDPIDETAAFDIGAVDYVVKPFNPAVVRARVRMHAELKRARDELERLAYIDGLTGAFNRRAFDDAFDREWRRLARTGDVMSIILCDVDFFKLYNDSYGHGAGDECLRQVGAALRAKVRRPGDMLARYGGEEFVALLPETGLNGAVELAAGFNAAIVALGIAHRKSTVAPPRDLEPWCGHAKSSTRHKPRNAA